MTPSEFYTTQFYTWEYRGRGWFVADRPIHLEPPFIPFYRHGYAFQQIDDGKRPTLVSRFIDSFKTPKEPIIIEDEQLDYETIELFENCDTVVLQALQIKLPKERKISVEKMKAVLIMLSSLPATISFELIGTEKEIIIQFVSPQQYSATVETYLAAYFPHCSIVYSDTFLEGILNAEYPAAVIDFGLKEEFVRPLSIVKNYTLDPLTGIIGALDKIASNQQAGIQILFEPAVNHWSESILRSVTLDDGTSFFGDAPEAPELAMQKVQSPLYGVTIRAFAQSKGVQDSMALLETLSIAIMNGCGGTSNELIPLSSEIYDFETRVVDIFTRNSHRLGMLLNVDELTTLLHLPSEFIVSKKLCGTSRKTKEAPAISKGKPFVIGDNLHNSIHTKVTLGIEERLKHTHIIGATGTGKSTLIANLILQDIANGMGVILFDPHGDLADDIIDHIPKERLTDVVLVDPSDTEYPIGLNILQAHSDTEKEVLSSDLVAAFRKYATSWGDQMNAVFGNAILAILESTEGGSLNDLRRFLIEKEFRNTYLQNVTDPSVIYYWQKEYPLLKSNSIGPILTRLDTFLRPKSIRNMVVQKSGLDFEALLNSNKIVLLKLSQGLIGMENSFLLGSLMLSKIHQAIFRRQQQSKRTPIFIYLDEFQNFITPSIKEMLSGIRKYNVGLTLSHQDLQQLQREDGELLNSVLGNITTRIVFRVGEPDAKKLQDGFSGFDYTDLQNLGRGEAVIRIEQPQYDCSLETILLVSISQDQKEANKNIVIENTRQQYAASKAEVEKMILESLNLSVTKEEQQPKSVAPKPVVKEEKPVEEYTASVETQIVVEPMQDEIISPPKPVKKKEVKKESVPVEKDLSTHRYLQTLVKKMAEARGYTAVLEMQLPDGSGNVDVLLTKESKTIAIEICITTDADWEMHNISKCITAKYDVVISLSGDTKQLEKIKQKCMSGIPDFNESVVHFFTPDVLFSYLDETVKEQAPTVTTMKGYRVNVTYDSISQEEMEQKRKSVAKVVMDSLRKRKK